MRVLIIDDEPNIRRTLRVALEATGHAVEEGATGADAVGAVERSAFDVALVDLRLGQESGLDLLEPLLTQSPRLAIVLITAHASIDTAVEAMRRGAFDYLAKPFTPAQSARSWSGWRGSGTCGIDSTTWRAGSEARYPRRTSGARTPRWVTCSTWPGKSPRPTSRP